MQDTDNIEVLANVENLELYSDSHPFRLSLRIENFESETDFKKFVRNCEMLTRRCNEYKLWKGYIIDVLGVNHCMITHEINGELTIEVHHHIPSLYTLISGLINKRIENNESFCSFDIAQEAIELHFRNKIGYVTLIKSLHEKFHNGYLDIPIDLVKGDYRYFISQYGKYLDDNEIDEIQRRQAVNRTNCNWVREDYPEAAEG